MNKDTICVFCTPIPKARPRMTKSGHIYTPKTTKEFENLIGLAYKSKARGSPPTDKAVEVNILCGIQPSKNLIKNQNSSDLPAEKPTKKPDIDNLIKSILDGLNGIAYIDDRQVVKVVAEKIYAIKPFVQVTVSTI